MEKSPSGTPELEVMVGMIAYLQCHIEAITQVLLRKGVIVSAEEFENVHQAVFDKEYIMRRQRIIDAMLDPGLRSELGF